MHTPLCWRGLNSAHRSQWKKTFTMSIWLQSGNVAACYLMTDIMFIPLYSMFFLYLLRNSILLVVLGSLMWTGVTLTAKVKIHCPILSGLGQSYLWGFRKSFDWFKRGRTMFRNVLMWSSFFSWEFEFKEFSRNKFCF